MFRKWETLSREDLQKLINESTSYSVILTKLNLKPKGVNHSEIKIYLKNKHFNVDTLVGRSIYRGNGAHKAKTLYEVLKKRYYLDLVIVLIFHNLTSFL